MSQHRKKPSTIRFAAPKLGRCQMGPFKATMVDGAGKYEPRNCDKPAVEVVANYQFCGECLARLRSIESIASHGPDVRGRTPEVNGNNLLRRAS